MNYYYEFPEEVSVFGQTGGGVYCLPNQSPAHGYEPAYSTHDYAVRYASRVWLENANGVSIIKPMNITAVDEREFTMIKLKARIISE